MDRDKITENKSQKLFSYGLVVCSITSVVVAFIMLAMLIKNGQVISEFYIPLAYLGAAAGFILIPKIKSIDVGNVKMELELKMEQKIEETKNEIKEQFDLESGIGKSPIENILQRTNEIVSTITEEHTETKTSALRVDYSNLNEIKNLPASFDFQKGKWGGKTESNKRKVIAEVKRYSDDYFKIKLDVKSTSIDNPLKGLVYFHLHQTFSNMVRVVMAKNGVAHLNLYAYGAFTVGIEADNGETNLEIDLAQDCPDAPKKFIES